MSRILRPLLAALVLAAPVPGCAAEPAPADPGRAVSRPAAPPASPAPTAEPAGLAGITAAHNRVRGRVGVPPLHWSPRLAQVAQRWARGCVDETAPRGMLDHSPGGGEGFDGPVGENIFATTAPKIDPAFAVEDWASEARDYDYAGNRCTAPMCGHYTQVVWRGTREVGCAVAHCPRLRFATVLVCNYWPAGNWVGERPY
jgi:hypothetical protein